MIPLSPAVYRALGGVLLLALVTLWGGCERSRATSAVQELGVVRGQLTEATAALAGKEAVLVELQAALGAWQATAAQQEAAIREAADRAETLARDLDRARRALLQAEVRDDEQSGCASLLAIDIAAVCPARAVGMRQRAAGGLSRPGGGGAGASGAAAGPAPDR